MCQKIFGKFSYERRSGCNSAFESKFTTASQQQSEQQSSSESVAGENVSSSDELIIEKEIFKKEVDVCSVKFLDKIFVSPKVSYNVNNSKSKRSRKFWKNYRKFKHDCVSTVVNDIPDKFDPRPFAEIIICGKSVRGLLDSGATSSILGKDAINFLVACGLKINKASCVVSTADGTPNSVLGHVDINVKYNGVEKVVNFLVVPSLQHQIYLGMNFWNAFGLAPVVVNELSEIKDSVRKTHPLAPEEHERLEQVKNKFPSFDKLGLGRTQSYQHRIVIKDNVLPIKQRHYPISPAVQKLVFEELDRMLQLGVIEKSTSSWSSPIVLVRKSNGKMRLCLDSRKVNAVTVKDAYPLPQIDGLLGRLKCTKFITSLDLKDAFWQIPMEPESRQYTAFTVPGRPLYHFTSMPFGLCNAAQSMSRLMDSIIPHELREHVFVYLDDLLIVSQTFEEHMGFLQEVAERLSNAGLTINVEKSHFVMSELKYLGYLVGEEGLRTDPEKVEAIKNFPAPKTVKQVRRLIGMVNWYRRFIPNCSEVLQPISNLTKKGVKFNWTDDAQRSFDKVKQLLSSAPVLVNPDYDKPFFIRCDASTEGIGSVLFQRNDSGDERPIAYLSQKLNKAQKNYSVTELECLAAVISVKKFRPYIELQDFTVITDHASLKWLMSQKDLSGRLARWSLKLQPYRFNIEHQKGSLNIVPDTLSRVDCDSIEELVANIPLIVGQIDLDSNEFQEVEYQQLLKRIQKCPENFPNLKVQNNRVYIRLDLKDHQLMSEIPVWKLWLPKSLVEKILKCEHDEPTAAHGGVRKTLDRISRFYYWPRMAKDVKMFVSQCEICKMSKATNQILRPPIGKPFLTERPFQRLYIDLIGPYPRSKTGKTQILIVVDHLTKFVILRTLSSATVNKIIFELKENVFNLFGVPEYLHSDNGPQFVSKDFQNFLSNLGVTHIKSAFYSPQANVSERVNRSIIASIRSYLKNDHRLWDVHLSEIAGALRSAIHQSTKQSPHFAVFGYHKIDNGKTYALLRETELLNVPEIEILPVNYRLPLVHEKILKELQNAFENYSKGYNLRSSVRSFEPGQIVYVRQHHLSDKSKQFSSKLAPVYSPAVVDSKIGNVIYKLNDEHGKFIGTYHTKDIKT